VTGLAELVRAQVETWDALLEEAVLGTGSPDEVAAALERFVAGSLGEPEEALFYVTGVGVVAGLRLVDGRAVVVKVHRWNASQERLAATQAVQRHLADRGLPVPRPLVTATSLGAGIATVEEHRPGRRVDGRTPEARATMAAGLHEILAATRGLDLPVGPAMVLPEASLWPEPHSVRFDFDATTEGAAWIDELGAAARHRLEAVDLEDRIGHFDWRVQNLAFDDRGDIVAVYDGDSFGTAPEPVAVANAAASFCVDWEAGHPDPPPTVDEMRAFVADYETARARPFDGEELEALDAANLMMIAYSARCQHSDLFLQPEIGDTRGIGWFRLLRERGERCFAP
jgi:Ser/Thr protein kinase RdoA (MazF antagonist)